MISNQRYSWSNPRSFIIGEEHHLDIQANLEEQHYVITGLGGDITPRRVNSLILEIATVQGDGTLGRREHRIFGRSQGQEQLIQAADEQAIVVGVGLIQEVNAVSLMIYTRRFDPKTGLLERQLTAQGHNNKTPDLYWYPDNGSIWPKAVSTTVLSHFGLGYHPLHGFILHVGASQLQAELVLTRRLTDLIPRLSGAGMAQLSMSP